MIDKMKAMLKSQDMCVLATSSENRPHCSLMAYVTDDSGERLYMATLRDSKKYSNLRSNPAVSLLVDTRQACAQGRGGLCALTVTGECAAVADLATKDALRKKILEKHAHLEMLLNDPDVEILCVEIESFLLLEGPVNAHYVKLS